MIPFVLIVNEPAGLSSTNKDRFCDLSQHCIVTEHASNVHVTGVFGDERYWRSVTMQSCSVTCSVTMQRVR